MLAKKTDTILISFEDAKSRIKNAKRIVYTGTPVKIRKKEYTKDITDKKEYFENAIKNRIFLEELVVQHPEMNKL